MQVLKELQMNLIFYKKKLGLTNEDISAKTGLPTATISRIISGKTKDPKHSTIKLIADALECTVDDLIGNKDAVRPYYLDDKTAALAKNLKDNAELKILLDEVSDLSSDDLKTLIGMVNILKRNMPATRLESLAH